MKLIKLILLFTTVLISSSLIAEPQVSDGIELSPGFLANLPPWEESETLPEAFLRDPPVYLDVDSKGTVYRQNLDQDKSGVYWHSTVRMTDQMMKELSSQREVILQNMEDIILPGESSSQGTTAASTSNCPLPTSFSIVGNSAGQATGSQKVANTYRPAGVTTQWLVFDFYTINYRDRGSHMPMHLFHDEVIHGWGAFIGDNHGSPVSCGDNALFNSQIQGWTQYPPQPDPQVGSQDWQSVAFNGSNSCGNEMYDYPVIYNWNAYPKYRMEMQTSTGHWVAYRIHQFKTNPLRWEVLTDWKAKDVDTGDWPFPPHYFLTGKQGIFIQATDAVTSGSWSINIFNTQCGWF